MLVDFIIRSVTLLGLRQPECAESAARLGRSAPFSPPAIALPRRAGLFLVGRLPLVDVLVPSGSIPAREGLSRYELCSMS